MTSPLPKVELFSDWWASPNPWKGWYGIILCCKWIKKEFSQGYQYTTNNRMELSWVIAWLEKLKTKSQVTIYTDSQYTINGIEKWRALKWKKNNWYRDATNKAINADLWDKLLTVIAQHEVSFVWVKGHNGHKENERCDELATLAMNMEELKVDKNFEASPDQKTKSQIELPFNENAITIKQVLWKWNPYMKVNKDWDLCRKCLTPVIKKFPKHTKKTLEKAYYYEYYLYCPNCKTMYMLEEAKKNIKTLQL